MIDSSVLVAIITALSGLAAIIPFLYQYRKGQITNRQEVLFAHIKDLNESKELVLAKQLIAYKKVRNPNGGWFSPRHYNLKDLQFLKDETDGLDDPGKLEIKESLDSFIVFLGKVGYSLYVGAIERNEIMYFQYWIYKTLDDEVVQDYINHHQFPLYQMLLEELTKTRMKGFLSQLNKSFSYQKTLGKPISPEQRESLKNKLKPMPVARS